jgi:hypothetical protein
MDLGRDEMFYTEYLAPQASNEDNPIVSHKVGQWRHHQFGNFELSLKVLIYEGGGYPRFQDLSRIVSQEGSS